MSRTTKALGSIWTLAMVVIAAVTVAQASGDEHTTTVQAAFLLLFVVVLWAIGLAALVFAGRLVKWWGRWVMRPPRDRSTR